MFIVLGRCSDRCLFYLAGVLIGAPFFLLWDFKKWRRRSLSQKNLSGYMDDPAGFMQKRSSSILDKGQWGESVMNVNLFYF